MSPACRPWTEPWVCARSQGQCWFGMVGPDDAHCAPQQRDLHQCASRKIAPDKPPIQSQLLSRSIAAPLFSVNLSTRPWSRLDHCRQAMLASPRGRKINNVSLFNGGVSPLAGLLSHKQQINQIRRQPSNHPNTRFSHSSVLKDITHRLGR
jgi:hypothetical protein